MRVSLTLTLQAKNELSDLCSFFMDDDTQDLMLSFCREFKEDTHRLANEIGYCGPKLIYVPETSIFKSRPDAPQIYKKLWYIIYEKEDMSLLHYIESQTNCKVLHNNSTMHLTPNFFYYNFFTENFVLEKGPGPSEFSIINKYEKNDISFLEHMTEDFKVLLTLEKNQTSFVNNYEKLCFLYHSNIPFTLPKNMSIEQLYTNTPKVLFEVVNIEDLQLKYLSPLFFTQPYKIEITTEVGK